MKKLVVLLLLCTATILTHAQITKSTAIDTPVIINGSIDTTRKPPVHKPLPPKPKGPKPITRELSFGPHLNTNGWGIVADLGKVTTDDDRHRDMFYSIKLFQFEFDEIKSPKEIKMDNTDQTTGEASKAYIYGKINNFYTLKLAYGFRKMIAGKPDPGTVSLHWVGAGGLSVGLLKPYYINAVYNGAEQPIKYGDSTKNAFLTQGDIIGGAGFGKGLGEIKIIPGLHAKTGLHVDFSKNRKWVIAAETGVDGEVYTKAVPIMANQKAVPYFFSAYLVFQFGRRW